MKICKIKFSPEIIFYLFIRQRLCFLNEVMGGLFHDPHGGVLNKEKTPPLTRQGFFLVAEGGFEPPTFGL